MDTVEAPEKSFTLIAYLRFQRAHETSKMEDTVRVVVLAMGDLVQYVVPSFPVFKATLREVKLQWEEDNTIHVFDAFARHCHLLDHHLPAIAMISFSYENAFIIEVYMK